jgi:hypothetical protein
MGIDGLVDWVTTGAGVVGAATAVRGAVGAEVTGRVGGRLALHPNNPSSKTRGAQICFKVSNG